MWMVPPRSTFALPERVILPPHLPRLRLKHELKDSVHPLAHRPMIFFGTCDLVRLLFLQSYVPAVAAACSSWTAKGSQLTRSSAHSLLHCGVADALTIHHSERQSQKGKGIQLTRSSTHSLAQSEGLG